MRKPKKTLKQTKVASAKRTEAFCQAFIVDLVGTKAAIAAGYSEKTARVTASKLLTKVNIRTRIAELMDERSKRTMVDADFIVRNLVDITMKCQSKVPVMVFDPVKKCMEQKKDDEGGNVWEFESNGANRALELLGRHLAMFTEKSKIIISQEQPLFDLK